MSALDVLKAALLPQKQRGNAVPGAHRLHLERTAEQHAAFQGHRLGEWFPHGDPAQSAHRSQAHCQDCGARAEVHAGAAAEVHGPAVSSACTRKPFTKTLAKSGRSEWDPHQVSPTEPRPSTFRVNGDEAEHFAGNGKKIGLSRVTAGGVTAHHYGSSTYENLGTFPHHAAAHAAIARREASTTKTRKDTMLPSSRLNAFSEFSGSTTIAKVGEPHPGDNHVRCPTCEGGGAGSSRRSSGCETCKGAGIISHHRAEQLKKERMGTQGLRHPHLEEGEDHDGSGMFGPEPYRIPGALKGLDAASRNKPGKLRGKTLQRLPSGHVIEKEVTVAETAIQAESGASTLAGAKGAGSVWCPECRKTQKLTDDGRCPDCTMALAAHAPGRARREKGDGNGQAESSAAKVAKDSTAKPAGGHWATVAKGPTPGTHRVDCSCGHSAIFGHLKYAEQAAADHVEAHEGDTRKTALDELADVLKGSVLPDHADFKVGDEVEHGPEKYARKVVVAGLRRNGNLHVHHREADVYYDVHHSEARHVTGKTKGEDPMPDGYHKPQGKWNDVEPLGHDAAVKAGERWREIIGHKVCKSCGAQGPKDKPCPSCGGTLTGKTTAPALEDLRKAFGAAGDPGAGGQTVTIDPSGPSKAPSGQAKGFPGDEPVEQRSTPDSDHHSNMSGVPTECPFCGQMIGELDEKADQGAPAHKCLEGSLDLLKAIGPSARDSTPEQRAKLQEGINATHAWSSRRPEGMNDSMWHGALRGEHHEGLHSRTSHRECPLCSASKTALEQLADDVGKVSTITGNGYHAVGAPTSDAIEGGGNYEARHYHIGDDMAATHRSTLIGRSSHVGMGRFHAESASGEDLGEHGGMDGAHRAIVAHHRASHPRAEAVGRGKHSRMIHGN